MARDIGHVVRKALMECRAKGAEAKVHMDSTDVCAKTSVPECSARKSKLEHRSDLGRLFCSTSPGSPVGAHREQHIGTLGCWQGPTEGDVVREGYRERSSCGIKMVDLSSVGRGAPSEVLYLREISLGDSGGGR